VKALSTRLLPLLNRQLSGVPMLVALLESGEEMLSYFEFDAQHLERLINSNGGEQGQVAHEDIEMLAIGIINGDYLASCISESLPRMSRPRWPSKRCAPIYSRSIRCARTWAARVRSWHRSRRRPCRIRLVARLRMFR
jgi:hypothetical protein